MASFGPDVPAEVLRWAEGLPTVYEDAHRFYATRASALVVRAVG